MNPIPVGTVVDYHGSQKHGRYVIISHEDPDGAFTASELIQIAKGDQTLEDSYPDGVAYGLFPEGMERSYRNRGYAVYRVRRKSLTVVNDAGVAGGDS